MQYQALEAPNELRDTIQGFWYTSIHFAELAEGFEILPDGFAEIIFHFGGPCSMDINGRQQPLPSPFLMGLLNQPVLLHAESQLEIIGVKCFPWSVFELLGLPSGPNGVRIFAHPIARLHATLAEQIQAGKIEEALTLLKQYFLDARPGLVTDNMLGKAGAAMREAHGTLPVSQVAAAAHATVRTLERNFKHAAGYTVKDVSGLMRFEQARNHLWLHPAANLAGLAQDLGYADQAHFTREFKRYSGTTPAAFARKAKTRQQTMPDTFVAFVQS